MPMMTTTVRILASTKEQPAKVEGQPDPIIKYAPLITCQMDSAQHLPHAGDKMSLNDWNERKTYGFEIVSMEHVWNLRHEAVPIVLIFAKNVTMIEMPEAIPHPSKRIITRG